MTDPTPEYLHIPARLVAAREIASAEKAWSAARAIEARGMSTQERIATESLRNVFSELIEEELIGTEEILRIFADTPELANATIKRIEMNGDWDATADFERDVLGNLYDVGYKGRLEFIPSNSAEARTEITLTPGLTREHGFVGLQRKRLFVRAMHFAGSDAPRQFIELDKVSSFALDINRLASLSDKAAAEVRLIVAAAMYRTIGWDALRRGMNAHDVADLAAVLHFIDSKEDDDVYFSEALEDLYILSNIMSRYNMELPTVEHHAHNVELPNRVRSAEATRFIERSIFEQTRLLTPAATTYYVHSPLQPHDQPA